MSDEREVEREYLIEEARQLDRYREMCDDEYSPNGMEE